jgi:hypothetical protein
MLKLLLIFKEVFPNPSYGELYQYIYRWIDSNLGRKLKPILMFTMHLHRILFAVVTSIFSALFSGLVILRMSLGIMCLTWGDFPYIWFPGIRTWSKQTSWQGWKARTTDVQGQPGTQNTKWDAPHTRFLSWFSDIGCSFFL